jgi:hypothetical protein
MKQVIELISSFPTVVWTALLAFCLAWWLISLAASGIDAGGDGDADGDGDFDADADGDADTDSSDELAGRLTKALHVGQVPLSLSLTVLAFVGWTTSGLLQLIVGSLTDERNIPKAVLAAGSVLVFFFAGFIGLKALHQFARMSEPLFTTTKAPDRHAALGATCRIRTTHVTASLGEAEVINGVAKGQIVRVRTDSGDFVRGDIAHLVGYDSANGAFTIVELDETLKSTL